MENEGPAHILICDDETGIRESLKLILDRQYRLSYASHGKDVVEFLKRNRKTPPDMLIMDIKMPHLNGLDALRQVRRINRKIRVLIITGYESSDVAAQAIRFGANDYLTKPFDRETVREKVHSLLSPPFGR
jgi:YesN/AraC family two-component response regulator